MSQKKSPKSSKSVEARLEALSCRQDRIDKAIHRVEQQLTKVCPSLHADGCQCLCGLSFSLNLRSSVSLLDAKFAVAFQWIVYIACVCCEVYVVSAFCVKVYTATYTRMHSVQTLHY